MTQTGVVFCNGMRGLVRKSTRNLPFFSSLPLFILMSNLVITLLYYGFFPTTFLPKDCSLFRNALLSGELILLPQDISVREVSSLRYASRLGLVDRSPCDVAGAFFQELTINLYQMWSKLNIVHRTDILLTK